MIIYVRKKELVDIIQHIENIEEEFWLKHKFYDVNTRERIKSEFLTIYNKLFELCKEDGSQLEMELSN